MTIFHPIQNNDRRITSIPDFVALRAYEVYCELYGTQPALINVEAGCRGGFSTLEIIAFLYARSFPKQEWRKRFEGALERPLPK
jgi:hypothetical protein